MNLVLKLIHKWSRHTFIIASGATAFLLCWVILQDSATRTGFVSFNGRTEFVAVTVSATESQYQWSIPGAFICYDPEWTVPELPDFTSDAAPNDKLCGGPRGTSNRKMIPLLDDLSLAVVEDTTIEVAVSGPPLQVEGDAYSQALATGHILIIKKSASLSDERCTSAPEGTPILINGDGRAAGLSEEVEIHIPMIERTLMPFVGKMHLGQPKSSNSPNQLKAGVVAVYRPITRLFDTPAPQLVRETTLFPGDVLKFEDDAGCLVSSSGFLKAEVDDGGGYIQVVASVQSKEGSAIVERATPGSGADGGRIVVELQLGDAIFSHPYTVWLGLLLTCFILVKEGIEFWGGPSEIAPNSLSRRRHKKSR